MGKTITIEDEDWICGQQFTQGDIDALQALGRRACRPDAMFAEVGSWKGFSAFVLANILRGDGLLYAIDHWLGSKDSWMEETAKKEDVYSIFKSTMFKFDLWGIVRPMVMTSESAARIFKDGILDLVFIDADHSYGSIKQDIELWLPKVKAGGILCGHDCEGYYTQYTEVQKKTFGDGNIEFVYIAKNVGIHPGVIKAVYDTLGSQYQIVPNSKVWYHKK